METNTKSVCLGKKISLIRELRGIKQESLAIELGVSQQTISRMEASETINNELLERVAKILDVPAEGIKNFSEDMVFNIISNTYDNTNNNLSLTPNLSNHHPTFNTIEKIIELYERLLKSEQEKVELLKQALNGK